MEYQIRSDTDKLGFVRRFISSEIGMLIIRELTCLSISITMMIGPINKLNS